MFGTVNHASSLALRRTPLDKKIACIADFLIIPTVTVSANRWYCSTHNEIDASL